MARTRVFSKTGVLATAALLLAAVAPACGSIDETKFGAPTGLASKPLPDPLYAGAVTPAGDAGVTPTSTLCNGGPTVSDPNCVQKWSDIYAKYVKATGTWKCADAQCHQPAGSGNPPFPPSISNDDPKKAWESLVAHKLANKRYIDPCTKTPENSAMNCNLVGTCTPQMPQTGTGVSVGAATTAELTEVNLWLACGAPNN